MSTMLLIRHGQASFGAANYDVLSDLGRKQSRTIGPVVRHRGIDALYTGPLQRQRDTVTEMISVCPDLPEPTVLDGFSEYPAFKLFAHWLPVLQESDPEIRALIDEAKEGRRYQELYVLISQKWASGELGGDGLETYPSFSSRINDALDSIMTEQGRGKTIAVVTSGGPIAIAMARALDLAPAVALKAAWVLANASISEFRYRQDEFTMVGFNRVAHVSTDELLTYR
jgi:broad specificity phosphatase PhoE